MNDSSTIRLSGPSGDEQSIGPSSISWLETIGNSVVNMLAGHTAQGIEGYAEMFDPEDRTEQTALRNESSGEDERDSIISRASTKWVENNEGRHTLPSVDNLSETILELAVSRISGE
jgi:hypothetical protein